MKRYKRNTTSGDLQRSRKIASSFDIEIRGITAKYNKAGYPRRFIESVIRDFVSYSTKYVRSKETVSTVL